MLPAKSNSLARCATGTDRLAFSKTSGRVGQNVKPFVVLVCVWEREGRGEKEEEEEEERGGRGEEGGKGGRLGEGRGERGGAGGADV